MDVLCILYPSSILTCTAGSRPGSAAGIVAPAAAVGADVGGGRRDALEAGAVNDLTGETVDEEAEALLQRWRLISMRVVSH